MCDHDDELFWSVRKKKTCFKWKVLVPQEGELSEIFSSMWTLKTWEHMCLITLICIHRKLLESKNDICKVVQWNFQIALYVWVEWRKSYSQRSLCTYCKSHNLLYKVNLILGLSYQSHLYIILINFRPWLRFSVLLQVVVQVILQWL